MTTNWWNEVKNSNQIIKIDWEEKQGSIWWNEVCALVLEHFGLPGNRFYYSPHLDYMLFKFKTEEDALMCKILLSDRIS